MNAGMNRIVRSWAVAALALILSAVCFATPRAGAQGTAQPSVARVIGTIKAIDGSTLTITPTSRSEITAVVQPNARVLRLEAGEKDVKNATPIQLQDLRVGDTVRVRGFAAPDAKSIPALEVLVISHSAVTAVSDQIRQDWQKRGIGGLVSAVDPAAGTITISVTSFSGKKTIAIHTSGKTIFRRYSPQSIKFEDARPSSLAQIQPGDQVRARGERSADGAEFTAEEVVSGRFRNIAGTVTSANASAGTITVQDVLSKKPVEVKITPDSQLHQIPAEMAQRIAMRLKAAMAGGAPPGTPGAQAAANASPDHNASGPPGQGPGGQHGAGAGMGGARSGDLQQMLSHLPTVSLPDLHKGDAVMMVATEGTATDPSTAVMLLSGVDPILRAAPNASEAMMMSPWSLGGMPAGADAGNQ